MSTMLMRLTIASLLTACGGVSDDGAPMGQAAPGAHVAQAAPAPIGPTGEATPAPALSRAEAALALAEESGAATWAAPALAEARAAAAAGRQDEAVTLAAQAGEQAATLAAHAALRVQVLREDEAAAVAHAAKAVEQAQGVAPRELLPDGARSVLPAEIHQRRSRGENVLLVDVRPRVAFEREHAEGAAHVPAPLLAEREVPPGADLVLIGGASEDPAVAEAARGLIARGVPFVVVAGGVAQWRADGLPVVALAQPTGPDAPIDVVPPAALLVPGQPQPDLIDVRPAVAYDGGHIPASRNVPLALLGDLPLPDAPAVIVAADDASGARAARALLARGAPRVQVLEGGILAYARAGGRLTPAQPGRTP